MRFPYRRLAALSADQQPARKHELTEWGFLSLPEAAYGARAMAGSKGCDAKYNKHRGHSMT